MIRIFKNTGLFLCFSLLIGSGFSASFAQEINEQSQENLVFLEALPEIPLMHGLQELEDQSVIFDKPGGRIVEVYIALGDTDPFAVRSYYQNTLPQLGWRLTGSNAYTRENEYLYLNFESSEGENYLHFTLTPEPHSVSDIVQ